MTEDEYIKRAFERLIGAGDKPENAMPTAIALYMDWHERGEPEEETPEENADAEIEEWTP